MIIYSIFMNSTIITAMTLHYYDFCYFYMYYHHSLAHRDRRLGLRVWRLSGVPTMGRYHGPVTVSWVLSMCALLGL